MGLSWSTAGSDVFGCLTGDAKRVPGNNGRGIELTSRGELSPALFPIDEELQLPDTDYAVAFWFKTIDADVRLYEARRHSRYNNRWGDHELRLEGGKLQFRLDGDDPVTAAVKANDGEWHHAVSTVGPGGQRLYLEGKLVGTGKLSRRTRNSNRFGLDGGKDTVAFDELRVFGKMPTAAAVADLFAELTR